MELTKQNIYSKIDMLLDDYKDNEDMLKKVEDYIVHQLPTIMRNVNNTHIERENRKNLLEENSTDFIVNYVKSCPYYYCSTTEIFFEYKDNHYACIREDSVLCNILNAISSSDFIAAYFSANLRSSSFRFAASCSTSVLLSSACEGSDD